MLNFELRFPEHIIFGEDLADNVGKYVVDFGEKALIVTGASSAKKSGALERVQTSLENEGVDSLVYDGVDREPDAEMVDEVREKAHNEQVDFIVGLGGGSVLDVAKAAAGLIGNPDPTVKYLNADSFTPQDVPFVALPTTSGTGSEITLNSVLYNPENGNKNSIAHPDFQADLGIVDPTLTYSMPPKITAASGMDALTHAVESYTSKAANPVTKALAGRAIQLIGESLVPAVEDGANREARAKMALGSAVAALAFAQTGVGVAHSISHPLGAIFHIPHGVANAILLPVVIDYNSQACKDDYDEIVRLLGEEGDLSLIIEELVKELPIPTNLKEAGYEEGREEKMIEKTFQSRSLKKNPRKVVNKDIINILKRCL